jgi:hypothetical protein
MTSGIRNVSLTPRKPPKVARASAICGNVLLLQVIVKPPAMISTGKLVEASTVKPALSVLLLEEW